MRERRILSSWLREPLLHFTVLAGALFLLNQLIDKATIDFLVRQREDLELRKLSPEERRETVEQFIEDEILYQEAYRRGLDRGDARMRRNLILKMRGLLAGDIGEPSDVELRAWYEANQYRFTRSENWSFEQVSFADHDDVPADLLARLRQGLDPASVGDGRLALPRSLSNLSQRALAGTFGPNATRAMLAIDDDRWHGPIESVLGVHFVRITGHQAEHVQTFENVEPYLLGEWQLARTRERIDQEVKRLRGDYEISIESGAEDS